MLMCCRFHVCYFSDHYQFCYFSDQCGLACSLDQFRSMLNQNSALSTSTKKISLIEQGTTSPVIGGTCSRRPSRRQVLHLIRRPKLSNTLQSRFCVCTLIFTLLIFSEVALLVFLLTADSLLMHMMQVHQWSYGGEQPQKVVA